MFRHSKMADATAPERSFACYYCQTEGPFEEIINHCLDKHQSQILKIKRRELNFNTGNQGYRTLNFKVIPIILTETGKYVIPNKVEQNIEILDIEDDFGLSDLSLDNTEDCNCQFHKRIKTSTPHKIAQESIASTFVVFECDEDTNDASDSNIITEITTLLPTVVSELRNVGQLENRYVFHKLVNDGQFPMNNIAFHLFMDVCKFYSGDNIRSMRFNPIVKKFWRIGYCLFHGKWLNFMSGPKSSGQKVENPDASLLSADSDINFAVPYRATVGSQSKPFSEEDIDPGLLMPMINTLADQNVYTLQLI